MYYTRSRGGVVALLAVVGLLLSRRWGKTKTVFVVGALGAAMFALQFTGGRGVGGGDDSSEGRIDAWAEGFHMLGTHPALGVGYNGFRDYNALTAHNSYVLCFSETGVAGYFFWTSLIVATLLQLAGLLKIPREDQIGESVRRWAGTLQLSLCGFLVAGFFLSRTYVYIMYTLVAMVCGLTLIAQRERIEMVFPSLKKIVKVTMLIEAVSLVAIYFIVRVDPLLHGG
jgi:O-antigen ligase